MANWRMDDGGQVFRDHQPVGRIDGQGVVWDRLGRQMGRISNGEVYRQGEFTPVGKIDALGIILDKWGMSTGRQLEQPLLLHAALEFNLLD